MDRPVRAGQWLLAIYQEDGPWVVESRIPEHAVGKFLDNTRTNRAASIEATATLDSHPLIVFPAIYQESKSATSLTSMTPNGNQSELRVRFVVPTSQLPHRNAGAAAQVHLSFGQGTLAESLCGDAIKKLWAKLRMWI